jgi:hypothetical protein
MMSAFVGENVLGGNLPGHQRSRLTHCFSAHDASLRSMYHVRQRASMQKLEQVLREGEATFGCAADEANNTAAVQVCAWRAAASWCG